MKSCRFHRCAVCTDIKYRNLFKYVFRERYPDVIICSNASYRITNRNGHTFIINDIDHIKEGIKSFYVTDLYTGMPIYLSSGNFEILCNANPKDCEKTEHVATYDSTESLKKCD